MIARGGEQVQNRVAVPIFLIPADKVRTPKGIDDLLHQRYVIAFGGGHALQRDPQQRVSSMFCLEVGRLQFSDERLRARARALLEGFYESIRSRARTFVQGIYLALRQVLRSDFLQFGVDTEENEPQKV